MGTTKIEQPAAPAAPSVTSSMTDYINNYPALFKLMQQYAPQEAQQQVDLASQYAAPLGGALKTAQEAMYPTETGLTNMLNQQITQGLQSGTPQSVRDRYRSDVAANLGTNIGSPIGAFSTADQMQQLDEQYRNLYQNMALSVTGRQPVYSAQPTQYTNQMQNYTPQGVMNYNSQNYGSYAGLYGNMYGANQQAQASSNDMWSKIIGSGLGAVGTMGAALMPRR